MNKFFAILITLVLLLMVFTENHSTSIVGAHGGRNNECDNADDINPVNDSLATYTAPVGQVVTGVCIKAGNDMFGDGHSEVLVDGTYNGTNNAPCYVVTGVGTQTVTVTRIASGNACKGISHIDVYTGIVPTNTPTPTTTPTNTPTPTVTPTNTPTPTPTVTVTDTPTPTPTTGQGQGGNDPTPTTTPTEIPTPTPTITVGTGGSGDGKSDGLSDGRSDGKSSGSVLGASTSQKKGEVLGVSTMAGTGSFAANVATIETALGLVLASIGFRLNGKKKSTKSK